MELLNIDMEIQIEYALLLKPQHYRDESFKDRQGVSEGRPAFGVSFHNYNSGQSIPYISWKVIYFSF